MNKNITELLDNSVEEMLEKISSDKKYKELIKKHKEKVHFIPFEYRVFNGQLHSLNIQFGNFLESFIEKIIGNEEKFNILEEYSGKKNNNFEISLFNNELIDKYITDCQQGNIGDLKNEFSILTEQILINNKRSYEMSQFNHDIDVLFQDKTSKIFYYLEVKYQDDHDTGKFVEINRKFIKTYAFLTKELNIEQKEQLVPIIFYFNKTKNIGNIYVPETNHILRGNEFFETFEFDVTYEEIQQLFMNTSKSTGNIEAFNNLYEKTMNITPPESI